MNDSYELWKQYSLIPEWMTQVIFCKLVYSVTSVVQFWNKIF